MHSRDLSPTGRGCSCFAPELVSRRTMVFGWPAVEVVVRTGKALVQTVGARGGKGESEI